MSTSIRLFFFHVIKSSHGLINVFLIETESFDLLMERFALILLQKSVNWLKKFYLFAKITETVISWIVKFLHNKTFNDRLLE